MTTTFKTAFNLAESLVLEVDSSRFTTVFNVLVSSPTANKTFEDSPVLARLESSSSLNFGHALEVSQQTDLDRFVGSKTRSVDCPTSCLSE